MFEQFLVTPQISFGILELNGARDLLRLRQVQLGLIGRRIDLDERDRRALTSCPSWKGIFMIMPST